MATIVTVTSVIAASESSAKPAVKLAEPTCAKGHVMCQTGSSTSPPGQTCTSASSDSSSEPTIAVTGSHSIRLRSWRGIGSRTAKAAAGSGGMRATQFIAYPFSSDRLVTSADARRPEDGDDEREPQPDLGSR